MKLGVGFVVQKKSHGT